jgi:FKBP-type peptidyl-prolyl cis-trans isomerase SlpA
MPEEVTMHSLVLMHYSIALTEGTVVESSFEDEPVEIKMGSNDLPEGMELAIYGLKVGDTQSLTLTAEQCFGMRDDDNIHMMPLSDFPAGLTPEIGLTYAFGTEEGEDITGTIRSVKQDTVEVDFNHPLAGHELVFTVEIIDVNNSQAQIPYDDQD